MHRALANHALQVGSWFPSAAQDEIFGADGSFRAPAVVSRSASRPSDDGGWELNGTVSYCSGAPYCTHYLGQAQDADGAGCSSSSRRAARSRSSTTGATSSA